jgi:transcriptional regulator with XRE-family HTH domain
MAKKKGERGLIAQLKSAIQGSGRSLNKIGKEAGVDPGRISRFLRGHRDLTGDAIEKLCKALRLELVDRKAEEE